MPGLPRTLQNFAERWPGDLPFWSVGNEIFAHHDKAQRPSGEVRASVADTGERDQSIYGVNYLSNQPVGGVGIIRRDELPNFVKVNPDFRVEIDH
jgi:hypothetical protein